MTTNTAKRNRIYITADLPGYEEGTVRVALNPEAAIEINDRNWATGTRMDRCWFGKGRIITQSYSLWEDRSRPGTCVGTSYDVIDDPSEILRFCRKAGIEPPAWVEIEEA